jgi:hypothetical protein
VTNEQAVREILGLIDSPLVGDVEHPGRTFQRIYGAGSSSGVYYSLSSGEQALADVAYSVWRGSDDEGVLSVLTAIGWLDQGLRAKVLGVLTALYVGEAAAAYAAGEGMEG